MKTCALALNLLVWVALGLTPVLPAVTVDSDPESLLLEAPKALSAEMKAPPAFASRSRVARLNPRLLQAGLGGLQQPGIRWKANLFPDVEPVVTIAQVEVKGNDRFVSIGQVDGVPGSQVILACVDGVMVGSVVVPGRGQFQIEYAGPGLHRVNEVDPGRRPPCGLEPGSKLRSAALPDRAPDVDQLERKLTEPPDDRVSNPGAFHLGAPKGPKADPVVVDFLVVYTAKALAGAGGEAGMQALIDFFVAEANTAYANSQINLRWNIAYQERTAYNDSGSLGTDGTRLITANDGYLDEVPGLRNTYAADLVMLMVELEEKGLSGIAGYDHSVFVRCWISAGFYMVAHEVGHLFGAGHDRLTCQEYGSGNCGAKYRYSYGHRFVAEDTTYITIMSYSPGVIVPYFSNPEVSFLGTPTGVAAGATNSADNARTINLEAPRVANLRRATNRFELFSPAYSVAETNGQVTVEVLRVGDTNTTASVQLRTVNGTASAGEDFTALSQELSFGPGETVHGVSVVILDDNLAEGPEQFQVTLSSPSRGDALNPRSSAVVIIHDDEPGLRFAATNVLVAESAAQATIRVQRTGAIGQSVSVHYAVSGGTATEGVDFEPLNGVLEFAATETEKTILLDLRDDQLSEPDEICLVSLSDAQGAVLVPPMTAVVRILDDERSGSLDVSFNQGLGPNGRVFALTPRPDGRILCGGWFTEVGGAPRTALVQYLPDGTVDPEFGPVEFRITSSLNALVLPAMLNRVKVLDDGKVLVAGTFASVNGIPRRHVARLHPDGSLDVTFAPRPGPDSQVLDVIQQPDGKILIGGSFRSVSGWSSGLVARLNPDGSVDESFRAVPQPKGIFVLTMVLQPDGKIVVGGIFAGFGAVARANLIRLDASGGGDTTFRPPEVTGEVDRIVLAPDGKLVVGGVFTSPRKKIFRVKSSGALDATFTASPVLNEGVRDLVLQPDGSMLIAGEFLSTPTQNRTRVARLKPNGALDTTFDAGTGPDEIVWAVAMQPDGWILVGGQFTAVNGVSRPYLARLRSDGTRPTFATPTWLANGDVSMKLFGNAGGVYQLERSTDLADWLPVWTNTLTGTSWEWTGSAATAGQEFYRAVSVP